MTDFFDKFFLTHRCVWLLALCACCLWALPAWASAPAAPTALIATPGNARVALTWTASGGATSYNILRSATSGGVYTQVGTSATVSYTDTTNNTTTEFYVVQAVSGGGTSPNSLEVAAMRLTNWSFETPSLSAGGFTNNPTNTGWTFIGVGGVLTNGNGTFIPPNAPDGTQAGWVGSYSGGLGSISQSINFPASGTYSISFQLASTFNSTTQPLQMSIDGVNVGGTLSPASSSSYGPLTSSVFTISTAGAHTIALASTKPAGNNFTVVDMVTINQFSITILPPTGVAATPGNAQVALTWASSAGATSYAIMRAATPGGAYTQIGTSTSASYTDSTAANNTTYYYKIQAISPGALSTYSSEVSATPGGVNGLLGWWKLDDDTGSSASDASAFSNTGTFTSPGWVTGRNGYAGSFNGSSSMVDMGKGLTATANSLSVACWVKLTSTSGYQAFVSQDGSSVSAFLLEKHTNGKFCFTMMGSDSTASRIDAFSTTTPVVGVWYHLIGVYDAVNSQIKLYVNGALQGTTAFSSPWSATGNTVIGRAKWAGSSFAWANGLIDDVRLYNRLMTAGEIATDSAYPTGVTGAGVTTSATISWTAFPSATSYNLYRSTTSGSEGGTAIQTGLTGTSYTNTGLTSATTYYYKLSATTASGESAQSDEVSATPLSVPTALTAVPGNTSATLSWAAVTGATTYAVLRSTTSGSGYVAVTGGTSVAGTTFTDPNGGVALTNGTTYYYVVTASSSGGTSSYSAQAAVTPAAPTLLLVKRITAINGIAISTFISDGAGNDTNAFWPSPSTTYLRGGLAATNKPGDTVEYTIYFLAIGSGGVTSVVVSNVLPNNVSFNATAYNSLTPTDGGSGNSGLALGLSSVSYPSAPTIYLSDASGSDRGTYYATGVAVAGICTALQNINGVIAVNVVTSPTTLPAATAASSPYNSYGFIRYQVTIR